MEENGMEENYSLMTFSKMKTEQDSDICCLLMAILG